MYEVFALPKGFFNDNLQVQFSKDDYPFWFATANYYILTVAISIASFFVIWGVLHGADDETPWINAGIAASLVIIAAVMVRELVFRKIFRTRMLARKQLDSQLKSVYKQRTGKIGANRLTLERNSEVLSEIENMSQSAKALGSNGERHLEVFQLCSDYLRKAEKELNGILKESPRYAVLRNGRERVQRLRRFHLLSWAAMESQAFIQNSKFQVGMNEKIENAQRAYGVIDSALKFYPEESKLLESLDSVREYIVSVKVNHWIEQAERAAFKGNNSRAINHYKDALFFLARENDRKEEHSIVAREIMGKIEELKANVIE